MLNAQRAATIEKSIIGCSKKDGLSDVDRVQGVVDLLYGQACMTVQEKSWAACVFEIRISQSERFDKVDVLERRGDVVVVRYEFPVSFDARELIGQLVGEVDLVGFSNIV